MLEPIFINLDMASETTSTAYFINPSHQSVRVCVFSFIVARKEIGEGVLAATIR
jgi:hypothetical protein